MMANWVWLWYFYTLSEQSKTIFYIMCLIWFLHISFILPIVKPNFRQIIISGVLYTLIHTLITFRLFFLAVTSRLFAAFCWFFLFRSLTHTLYVYTRSNLKTQIYTLPLLINTQFNHTHWQDYMYNYTTIYVI